MFLKYLNEYNEWELASVVLKGNQLKKSMDFKLQNKSYIKLFIVLSNDKIYLWFVSRFQTQ